MRKAEDRKNIETHVCVLHALQNAALHEQKSKNIIMCFF